ncbi:MAG: sulfatase, partial [Acidobacteriota bacterium]
MLIRVVASEPGGEEQTVGTVEMGREPGTWTDIDFDLSDFQGKSVDLAFEARVSGSKRPDWPVFVANPEFLAGDRRQPLPDILVISVDTLRSDRLSLLGYSRPTTPLLDRWAQETAVVFPEVIAAAPWTLPAHVSLFTGLDAVRHGVNHDVGDMTVLAGTAPVTELDFMAETLRQAGYSTAAFTGGAYVGHNFGFAQGFDIYSSWPDRARDFDELPTGVAKTLEFFRSRQTEPAFVFLHTYAVHDPYRAWPGHFAGMGVWEETEARIALKSPKNLPELGFRQVNQLVFRPRRGGHRPTTPDELDLANQMYDSGVSFVDHHLGHLLKSLNQQGLDRNLLVVLTSDHGESLGEGGRFGHVDLTDEVLRVPLLLAFPDRRAAGKVIERQVRQVDIWPTVAEAAGLAPVAGWDGISLSPLIEGGSWAGSGEAWAYSAAANRGIGLRLEGRKKMIFDNTAWRGVGSQVQLFDLKTDRSEVLNLAENDVRTKILLMRVAEYLHHSASGLRLRLVNRTTEPILGTVEGPMVRPIGTKVLTPEGPALKWKEMGSAEFSIPPGSQVTYSFEKVFGRKLRVRGHVHDAPFDHSIDVRSLRGSGI